MICQFILNNKLCIYVQINKIIYVKLYLVHKSSECSPQCQNHKRKE